jgi:redox-sensing transcriptional repressor
MGKISEFTVRRMSSYLRLLAELDSRRVSTVSSEQLAELGGITSAQVRKDLSYFGSFGKRGLGYNVVELKEAIRRILGLHQRWSMALFGAGSLGHALFFYEGFQQDGFYFTHIFDSDEAKIGTQWKTIEIRPVSEAEERLRTAPVEIGVITTPDKAAQEVADIMIRAGVKGVLNFAPTRVTLPDNMWLRNVNLAVALESLSFYLST